MPPFAARAQRTGAHEAHGDEELEGPHVAGEAPARDAPCPREDPRCRAKIDESAISSWLLRFLERRPRRFYSEKLYSPTNY